MLRRDPLVPRIDKKTTFAASSIPSPNQVDVVDTDAVQPAAKGDGYDARRASRQSSRSRRESSAFLLPELTSCRRLPLLVPSRRANLGYSSLQYFPIRVIDPNVPKWRAYCYNRSRGSKNPLIDDISKIVFPVGFALFNVVYWNYYYMD